MSVRQPPLRGPERRRAISGQRLGDRFGLPAARRGSSPMLTIIYILAAFICVFMCAIAVLIPLRWLFR